MKARKILHTLGAPIRFIRKVWNDWVNSGWVLSPKWVRDHRYEKGIARLRKGGKA